MSRSRARILRIAVGLLVAGLVVIVLLAGGAWWLAGRAPSWWAPLDGASADVRAAGEALENRTVNALHRIRGRGERWTLEVDEPAVNAWLAARWDNWLRSEPARAAGLEPLREIESLAVRFDTDRLRVGARLPDRLGRRILAAALAVESANATGGGGGGEAPRIELLEAAAGRLPLPVRLLRARITSTDTVVLDESGVVTPPWPVEIRLGDGRRVRVLDVELLPERARLHLETIR